MTKIMFNFTILDEYKFVLDICSSSHSPLCDIERVTNLLVNS